MHCERDGQGMNKGFRINVNNQRTKLSGMIWPLCAAQGVQSSWILDRNSQCGNSLRQHKTVRATALLEASPPNPSEGRMSGDLHIRESVGGESSVQYNALVLQEYRITLGAYGGDVNDSSPCDYLTIKLMQNQGAVTGSLTDLQLPCIDWSSDTGDDDRELTTSIKDKGFSPTQGLIRRCVQGTICDMIALISHGIH